MECYHNVLRNTPLVWVSSMESQQNELDGTRNTCRDEKAYKLQY